MLIYRIVIGKIWENYDLIHYFKRGRMAKTTEKIQAAVPLVDTVLKALEILDCFTTHENELSLNQLCERSGLYKSRVHRLCGTLIKAGYLSRISRTHYSLGPKLMVLGKVYEKSNSLKSVASPIMKRLSLETGESTALFALDGAKGICMAREMGSSRLVFSINEGDTMELTYTAAGRVLLAYNASEFVDKTVVKANQTQDKTIDPDQFRQELENIRQSGYCVDDQQSEEGLAAIAAPIFDYENKVTAALVVVGPAFRFSADRRQVQLEKLLTASHEISRLMGDS